MRWTGDMERGAWLTARLVGHGRDGVVPAGFGAYARVFHPSTRYWWDGPVNRLGSRRLRQEPVSWAQVAALRGTVAHSWMQWGGISGDPFEEVDLGDGTSIDSVEEGRLPPAVLTALLPLLGTATTTPDHITAGVWTGWGALHHVVRLGFSPDDLVPPVQERLSAAELGVDPAVTRALGHGPLLELPGRDYLLLTGALTDLQRPDWAARAGLGEGVGGGGVPAPQLLWPGDQAWCLATEIDLGFTLLAGTRTLINAVLTHPQLEAVELDHDGDLSWDGDTINPRP